jgi:iron complex outermembrane receptor protein
VTLRLGEQRIPYQGFPNQYMDMVDDRARFASLGYEGALGRAAITAKLYWQDTRHGMNNFTDEKPGMAMPMNVHGRNRGYALQADIALDAGSRLVVGHEYHGFRLDDRWPAVPGSMMMGPNDYVRINDGARNRAALFGEWEYRPDARWTLLVGVRGERVTTNAGAVQPYSAGASMDMGGMDMGMSTPMPDPDIMAAHDINLRSRARRDTNVDATASARLRIDADSRLEFGLARKVRSPNLYERYAWGRATMSMTMTNWFGDANGYVGDPDLKPEVATTASAALDWHGPDHAWQVNVSPFYTRVDGYIDTDVIAGFHPGMAMAADANLLRFANHDATLYGVNLAWQAALLQDASWGRFGLKGKASVTRGRRTDGNNLYRIMPANGSVALEHAQGAWASAAEAVFVDRKSRTDAHRLEPRTAGYTLLNLQTGYQMSKSVRFHGGVNNAFDKHYAAPLGGVYLARLVKDGMGALQPLPGYGRSVEMGALVSF